MRTTVMILGALLAGSTAFAQVPTGDDLRNAVNDSGNLVLGELAAFRSTHLADVTIQGPTFGDDGSVVGTSGGSSAKVLLQYVPGNSGIAKWVLAMKLPTQRLGSMLQAGARSGLDDLEVSTPVMVFAKQRTELSVASLDPKVRAFYSDAIGSRAGRISLEHGVNLFATVSGRGQIQTSANTLGINIGELALQGIVLKNFDASAVNRARKSGKLMSKLATDAELRAKLTDTAIKGLPRDFQIRDLSLVVTGKPSVGLQFYMTVGSGSQQRDFRCRSMFASSSTGGGRQSLSISAESDVDQPWQNAFGLKGLTLADATLEIRYERRGAGPPSALIGIGGKMQFGRKTATVAGGMQTKAGVVTAFVKGSLNSIHRDDLVAVINAMPKPGKARIDPRALPEFEIRDAKFTFAPMGGSDTLGIESGVGVAGNLFLFGKPVAQADVLADANQPLVRIDASVNQFQIGEVTLKQCKLDARLTPGIDSYFRFKGGARVLDIDADAEVRIDRTSALVKMRGKVANQFQADLLFKAPTGPVPNWQFEAALTADADAGIGKKIAADLRTWARQAKTDAEKTQADLNKAKADVNRINANIAMARQQVERERAQHKAALNSALQNQQRISQDVARARQQVEAERQRAMRTLNSARAKVAELQRSIDNARNTVKQKRARDLAVHKRDRDNAKRSLDSAQRAYDSAHRAWKREKNIFKKAKLGVTKDAKGVARDARKGVYKAAKAKYDVAYAAINKIPIDADPGVAALKTAKRTADGVLSAAQRKYRQFAGSVSVDNDPRVAQAKARMAVGTSAVRAAQAAFDLAHRAPVDADPRVAGLFAARDTALTALDVAKGAVTVADGAIQTATKIVAATADGDIIRIRSVKISGQLSDYNKGARVSVQITAELVKQPKSLRLSVSPNDIRSGNFVKLAADELIKLAKKG